jgi:hypothetical protein
MQLERQYDGIPNAIKDIITINNEYPTTKAKRIYAR